MFNVGKTKTYLHHFFETRMLLISIVILALSWSCADDNNSPDPEDPIGEYETWTGLQIVMFTPKDVELPDDYRERMREVTDYAEWFFEKWMAHWGYDCEKPLKISKDEQGYPILWRVAGKQSQSSGAYDKLGYAGTEVIPAAEKKYGIPSENQTWWIISYPGPSRRAYRGGGNFKGGTSSANFITGTGSIIIPGDDNLATGNALTFKLKAMIHELSHAFGLGHIGPREYDSLGNSLMGPTNNAYHKYYPEDDRVYLSEAAAAMLWKHPLFAGDFKQVNQIPEVTITDFQTSYNDSLDVLQVSGKLLSDFRAHSVVVANEAADDISGYWRKTYSARLSEDGSFICDITGPSKVSGNLFIAFCFNNGAISGTTGNFGLNKGFVKSYIFENNDFKF